VNGTILHVAADAAQAAQVSVVVPTYRRPVELGRLLQSLQTQTLGSRELEVVVADDGAPEDALPVVRRFDLAFARIVLVTGPNRGPGSARNRGAAVANGRFLAFVDDDCIAEPGWLSGLLAEFARGADMVQGPVTSSVPSVEPFVHAFRLDAPGRPGGIFAIRRERFVELGGFDRDLSRAGEDHEFFERVQRHGTLIAFAKEAVVIHPPRLKRPRIPLLERGPLSAIYGSAEHFGSRAPAMDRTWVSWNRRLLVRAVLKTAMMLAIGWAAFAAPVLALAAAAALVAKPALRWFEANRLLRLAGEPLRVPASWGIRYACVFPFFDQLEIIQRLTLGRFRIR
jgi:glycosyltransferase involved in cell wall biosynthesis